MLSAKRFKQDDLWLLVIPVLLLVTWLGTYGLADDSLWYDEWLAVYRAGSPQYGGPLSLVEVWSRVTAVGNFQMPAYYLLLAGWGGLAGLSEFAGRVLSLLLGVLTLAVVYRIGRAMDSPRAGLTAAVFLGVSAFYIHFFHEMRTYTLYGFFASLVILAYWMLVSKPLPKRRGWSFLFVMGMLGGLYSHYFASLLVLAVGLYHLLFVPKNARWWFVVKLMIVVGVLYLPWLSNALVAAARAQGTASLYEPGGNLVVNLEALLFALSNGNVAFVLLIGGLALPLRFFDGSNRKSRVFLWFITVVIILGAVALDAVFNIFRHIRYVFPLWITVALLLSLGTQYLAKYRIPSVLVVLIWMMIGVSNVLDRDYFYNLPATLVKLPFRDMADVLAVEGEADDLVLMHVPDYDWLRKPTFEHYMTGLPVQHNLLEAIEGLAGDEYQTAVHNMVKDHDRVWLGIDKTLPPTFRLEDTQQVLAEAGYHHCQTALDLPDLSLDLYARFTDQVDYRVGPYIKLALLQTQPNIRDDHLRLLFGWHVGEAVPADTYSVAVHIMDAAGELIAQADLEMPTYGFSCQPVAIPVQAVAAGDYTIHLAVYNWQTGQRLTIKSSENDLTTNHLVLYTISRDAS